jgi:hypothetical protein
MTVIDAVNQIALNTMDHLNVRYVRDKNGKITSARPYVINPSELRLKHAATLQKLVNDTVINTTRHITEMNKIHNELDEDELDYTDLGIQ